MIPGVIGGKVCFLNVHTFLFSFRIIYRVPHPLTLILGFQVKNRGGGVRPRAVSCDGPSPFTASPLRTLLLVLGNRQFRLWVHVHCLPALLYFCVCFLDPGRHRDFRSLDLTFLSCYLPLELLERLISERSMPLPPLIVSGSEVDQRGECAFSAECFWLL